MRAVLFLCACVYVVVGQDLNAMVNMPKYDERYDYLDVDAIFTNKRLVRNYVDCLISATRCSPEGKQLKSLLPEALRTKCIRCTDRQKKTAVKIIKRLKYEYPDEWAKVSSRWDPTGDFTRYFEEFLAKESFNSIPGSGTDILVGSSLPPPPPPRLPPAPPTEASQPAPTEATPPRPIILNRFGGDGELVGSASSGVTPPPPPVMTPAPTTRPTTMRTVLPMRPTPTRPTTMNWAGVASNTQSTRFPLRPVSDLPQPYSTAITLIDQIGYKIIRTTELVTDLLRNTVRAVVGR